MPETNLMDKYSQTRKDCINMLQRVIVNIYDEYSYRGKTRMCKYYLLGEDMDSLTPMTCQLSTIRRKISERKDVPR